MFKPFLKKIFGPFEYEMGSEALRFLELILHPN
jgi:hypothetical protein